MSIYRPKFLLEWLDIKRKGGYKLLLKKKGWQVLVAFILFYLIRDSILYIAGSSKPGKISPAVTSEAI